MGRMEYFEDLINVASWKGKTYHVCPTGSLTQISH